MTPETRAETFHGRADSELIENLVAPLQAAGLVETLKGKGPLTVFAPTDELFSV